jgi:hypothetical protein
LVNWVTANVDLARDLDDFRFARLSFHKHYPSVEEDQRQARPNLSTISKLLQEDKKHLKYGYSFAQMTNSNGSPVYYNLEDVYANGYKNILTTLFCSTRAGLSTKPIPQRLRLNRVHTLVSITNHQSTYGSNALLKKMLKTGKVEHVTHRSRRLEAAQAKPKRTGQGASAAVRKAYQANYTRFLAEDYRDLAQAERFVRDPSCEAVSPCCGGL